MKRPVGVIITVILTALGSLLFLGMAALEGGLYFWIQRTEAQPPAPGFIFVIGAAMFGIVGVWGVFTTVGLFKLRNWARICVIVFSCFLVMGCTFAAIGMLVLPTPPNLPPNAGFVFRIMAAVYLAIALLGGGLIYYFLRSATRAAFAGVTISQSARPVSISIIAWWLLASGVISLPLAFFRPPIVFGGLLLKGTSAEAVLIVLAIIQSLLGYGLLELNERARVLAVVYCVLLSLNGVIMALMPGVDRLMVEAVRSSPFMMPNVNPPVMPQWFFALGIAPVAIPVVFLVRRRNSFVQVPVEPKL